MCPGCMNSKKNKTCESCKEERECNIRTKKCKYKNNPYNYVRCEEINCVRTNNCICYNS